jgi:mannose-6-phosphate isomerase-like protein (cupin superfamily)
MPEYPRVQVAELPDAPNPTRHKKEVDEAVGASAFGFNHYTADPGQGLPWGYHAHPDHEELLYVLAGELAIETPDGEFRVGADEAVFVPPGAPQHARAVGDEPAEVIAVGAPKAADGAVISEPCPGCGEPTDRTHEEREVDDEPVYVLSCAACGAETDRLRAGPG